VLEEYDVDDAFIMNGRIDAVDIFIDQDSPAKMYEEAGLNADAIVAKVFAALGRQVAANRA
ncbi:MAG: hypothetical protein AAGJ85_06480, partial [Pseudomonadota bacterium]